MEKTLDELRVEFMTATNRNEMLWTMAKAARREGKDQTAAEAEICGIYDAFDAGAGRGAVEMQAHHAEVKRAVERVYNAPSSPATIAPAPTAKADREKLAKWHQKLTDGDWQGRITAWVKADVDGDHDGIGTADIIASLFRNSAGGYVAYYGNQSDTHWMPATDWSRYDGNGKYYTLQTFADRTAKRNEKNVEATAVFVVEIDTPHDATDAEAVTDEEKKELRLKNLADTCRMLNAIGIAPTTITFSGHKSWHVAWRLAHPVPKTDTAKKYGIMRDALRILGADPAMVSTPRSSRIPCRFPKACAESERATRQHCVYWNADAEVEYEALTDRIIALAEEVNGGKLRQVADLAKVCPWQTVEEQDADGNAVRKLKWKPELWEPMIKELGIFKIHRDGNPYYVRQTKEGLYKELSLDEVGDYVLGEIGRYNARYKALTREKRDVSQARWYAGITGRLNPIKDSREAVFVPFRDRIARITADGITITQGYGGYSIPENSPTINHELEWTDDECEFEVFLRHACGEVEQNPEWEKRYNAFRCLAGYLVSGAKEHTNWMCIISDESREENEGGTGKSIFMTGISKMVETEYRDERRKTRDAMRFEDSDWSATSRVLWKDEIPARYDWSQDFAPATGGKAIEQKGKNNRIKVSFEAMQKLVYCTNYYPSGLGASFDRRRKMYELSNHYRAKILTPEDEFGHLLFSDWDDGEWNRFYCFILRCVRYYLQCGHLIESGCRYEADKSEAANIGGDFVAWFDDAVASSVQILAGETFDIPQSDIVALYSEWYLKKYGRSPEALPRNRKNQWLKVLSENRGIEMTETVPHLNGKCVKCWRFHKKNLLPFRQNQNGSRADSKTVADENDGKNAAESAVATIQNGSKTKTVAETVADFDVDFQGVKCDLLPSTVLVPTFLEKKKNNITSNSASETVTVAEALDDPFLSDAPDAEPLESRRARIASLAAEMRKNASMNGGYTK